MAGAASVRTLSCLSKLLRCTLHAVCCTLYAATATYVHACTGANVKLLRDAVASLLTATQEAQAQTGRALPSSICAR